MEDREKNFLEEIEKKLESRKRAEKFYKWIRLILMVSIAICGFLTAAASQADTRETWVSSQNSLLIFGLVSAVCAVLNQVLSPSEKYLFHKNVKKALQYIRDEVKFGEMKASEASRLKAIALTSPDLVIGKLKGFFEDQDRNS